MSRGTDNCNPGNIRRSKVRYKGERHPSTDASFKQFESMEWGYRAMFVLLDTYRVRYGLNTLREIISRYAPPSENHTGLYIDMVCNILTILSEKICELCKHCRNILVKDADSANTAHWK